MNHNDNKIDPSAVSSNVLDKLADMIIKGNRPLLIGKQGVRLELPDAILRLLGQAVQMMREGRSLVLLPEDETCTTQSAADHLGMSRQFFVNLLESGKIPFHRVGSHRRIYFKDLLAFQKKRDRKRRKAMNGLFKAIDEAGVYDNTLPVEDEKG